MTRALRPPRSANISSDQITSQGAVGSRFLIVDLNNFASFPTLAVGILAAALRNRGHQVEVLCPLAYDVPATQRERQETLLDHAKRRIHLSDWSPILRARDLLRQAASRAAERAHPVVLREVARALERKPDVILVSAYLQHFESLRAIAALAKTKGVSVLLGGPMFNIAETADVWRALPGVSAVVGAEVDRDLADLAEALVSDRDMLSHTGVVLADGRRSAPAQPLRNLDAAPIPDFTDFPWDRYPVRIVPVMTGRGCQWDQCLFCSDVISVSGRTFRTRSVENVLVEMQEQARRHETTNFLFLDLKLNSWPGMIRGVAKGLGRYVQGAEWVGTVHVDQRADNGLTRADLHAAAEGGMRRISFGLESGSQALLDAMRKGSSVERNSTFIRDAHDAGLSIRCTMFKGFPGETAEDMQATVRFLEEHALFLDRVRFNDFTIHTGTPIWRALSEKADGASTLDIVRLDNRRARVLYRTREPRDAAYRRAKARALDLVYQINRREIRDAARQFDGLM
ncbi:B12-binding domain-containing radical SAM protein [Fuscibacter oryzae]|uniref:Radical SAM protein n=1 Tax=Fuscibacter oryzae TaxID=2803939 RepID=A0A8J7SXH6_9RHOB|nr:radical SAM protein [Fuscibacter oryzae]MBL4929994.1 radical SAM protein [Fuscibacter oryzae]